MLLTLLIDYNNYRRIPAVNHLSSRIGDVLIGMIFLNTLLYYVFIIVTV
jgi:hypothetical protein